MQKLCCRYSIVQASEVTLPLKRNLAAAFELVSFLKYSEITVFRGEDHQVDSNEVE